MNGRRPVRRERQPGGAPTIAWRAMRSRDHDVEQLRRGRRDIAVRTASRGVVRIERPRRWNAFSVAASPALIAVGARPRRRTARPAAPTAPAADRRASATASRPRPAISPARRTSALDVESAAAGLGQPDARARRGRPDAETARAPRRGGRRRPAAIGSSTTPPPIVADGESARKHDAVAPRQDERDDRAGAARAPRHRARPSRRDRRDAPAPTARRSPPAARRDRNASDGLARAVMHAHARAVLAAHVLLRSRCTRRSARRVTASVSRRRERVAARDARSTSMPPRLTATRRGAIAVVGLLAMNLHAAHADRPSGRQKLERIAGRDLARDERSGHDRAEPRTVNTRSIGKRTTDARARTGRRGRECRQ